MSFRNFNFNDDQSIASYSTTSKVHTNNTIQFSDVIAPIHAMSLASNLYKLLKDGGDASDVNVVCQEQTYKLHSTVLIHGSQYFRRLLLAEQQLESEFDAEVDADVDADADTTADTAAAVADLDKGNEEKQSQPPLPHNLRLEFNPPIQPSTFDIVIESLYTGRVNNMTEANITSLLEAYYQLEIDYAFHTCVQFMLKKLDMDNCLTFWLAGKFCQSAILQEKSIRLMGRHLDTFYTNNEFLELQSYTVTEILSQDVLEVPSEQIVFEAAMAWIKYDEEKRVGEISNIIDVVRMTYLPSFYLVNVVGKEDIIDNDKNAMSKYSKALKLQLCQSHGGEKQRHSSVHAVKGTLEKVQKKQSRAIMATLPENNNDYDDAAGDNENKDTKSDWLAGLKEIFTIKKKGDLIEDGHDEDGDSEDNEDEEDNDDDDDDGMVDVTNCFDSCRERVVLFKPRHVKDIEENYDDDHFNEQDFKEDDEMGDDGNEEINLPEQEEEQKEEEEESQEKEIEKPKNFLQNFLDSFKPKPKPAEENDEAVLTADTVVDNNEGDDNGFDENQFSVSYKRLEGVPEENDEDLSEALSNVESKSGLSYAASNEDIEKPSSDDNLLDLEMELDPNKNEDNDAEMVKEGDLSNKDESSDKYEHDDAEMVKEEDLLHLEFPQDQMDGKEKAKADDDSISC